MWYHVVMSIFEALIYAGGGGGGGIGNSVILRKENVKYTKTKVRLRIWFMENGFNTLISFLINFMCVMLPTV